MLDKVDIVALGEIVLHVYDQVDTYIYYHFWYAGGTIQTK